MTKGSCVWVVVCLVSMFSVTNAEFHDYTIHNKLDTTKYTIHNCYTFTDTKSAIDTPNIVEFSKAVVLSVKLSPHDGMGIKCDIRGNGCDKGKKCYFSFYLQRNEKHLIKIKGPFIITGPTKKAPHTYILWDQEELCFSKGICQ